MKNSTRIASLLVLTVVFSFLLTACNSNTTTTPAAPAGDTTMPATTDTYGTK